MLEKITKITEGYKIILDGSELFVPEDPSNRHFQLIQEEIQNGFVVELEELPQGSPNLTFAQMLIGLVSEAWITEQEGDDWLRGILPATVITVIDQLPPEQRFIAKARAIRPTEVIRNDPLVNALAQFAGKTQEELDTFFQTYSQV